MKWWKAIEEHVAEREREAPDPWGDRPLDDAALTGAQEDFLAGLDDQPRPPRLSQPEPFGSDDAPPDDPGGQHDETGNSPGDSADPRGVPSDP